MPGSAHLEKIEDLLFDAARDGAAGVTRVRSPSYVGLLWRVAGNLECRILDARYCDIVIIRLRTRR